MTRIQLFAVRDALRVSLALLDAVNVSCHTCEHFAAPHCKNFDAMPPADVVSAGCDEWRFDGVPF